MPKDDEQAAVAVSVVDADQDAPEVQMCCDGSGRTAEQHRAESPDHRVPAMISAPTNAHYPLIIRQ